MLVEELAGTLGAQPPSPDVWDTPGRRDGPTRLHPDHRIVSGTVEVDGARDPRTPTRSAWNCTG
ncbi:hypothetical protein CLV92_1324 [Kineococcus xinjiangensis]|uniref:Uncharacterized protein n=1 Tax=Kineococcus xinjiangensis TaxID=512762 RepID=A0A2S6IBS4_9ACTN|nr:hypothetical protein CLV92_1324 [Kineococcus xinjiangensis]